MNKIEALKVLARYPHLIDPDLGGEHGRTALHTAAIMDNVECMKILVREIFFTQA